jgi:hypothetical protein
MAKAKMNTPIRKAVQTQPKVRETNMNRATSGPRAGSSHSRRR